MKEFAPKIVKNVLLITTDQQHYMTLGINKVL